jgi:hypothetical protein
MAGKQRFYFRSIFIIRKGNAAIVAPRHLASGLKYFLAQVVLLGKIFQWNQILLTILYLLKCISELPNPFHQFGFLVALASA